MSSCPESLRRHRRALAGALTGALLGATTCAALAQAAPKPAASIYSGIGRPATQKEIAAWDIDVRPDFKGLPKGSGSVAQGQVVWESKCASCHGIFGESNEFFQPLVGGTTAADVKRGRVARLTDDAYPGRTTLMKLASVATLWDYIRRAMPWNAPKSLSHDEVYAVTAFVLNLGGVLPDDFALDEISIREVQQRLPNRLGMATDHGLWPGRGLGNGGRPDVRARACMNACTTDAHEATVASLLPEHARDAHGNLAEQNRGVGAQRGANTSRAAGSAAGATALSDGMRDSTRDSARDGTSADATVSSGPIAGARAATGLATPTAAAVQGQALAKKHNCLACHGVERKLVGPGLREVAKRYADRADAVDFLARKITQGGSGAWGPVAMPAQNLPPPDARALAAWLAAGAP